MRLAIFTLLTAFLSTAAFAYHRPSKGIGVACSFDVRIAPLTKSACPAPVLRSVRLDGEGRDVNGHNYRTTDRIVDRAACLEADISLTAKVPADMAKDVSASLPLATNYVDVSAAAVYKTNSGSIDVEQNSRGDLNYIYYHPSEEATAAQKSLVTALARDVLGGAAIHYDAAAKTLTLNAGEFSQTQPSDLSVGSLKGTAIFSLPLPAAKFSQREVKITAGCGALQ